MKKPWFLLVFALFLVTTASAVDVGIESGEDAFQLVVTSDYPITVSAYVVQLNYNPGIKVFQVDELDPFITVANINDEEGFVRIAAASATSAGPGQRIILAKIVAQPGFSPEVVVEELYDDDLQPIPVAGQPATPVLTTPPTLPVYTPAGIVTPAPSPAATVPPEVDVPWAPPTPIEVTGTAPPVSVTLTVTTPATGGPTVTATPPPPATGEAVVTGETPTQSASPQASTQTTPLSSIPVLGGMLIAIFIAVKRR